MPFLPDGTPLDIVLNPLGVPSRMNIGQVLEVHLGYAAKTLGWKVATPIFDGANEAGTSPTPWPSPAWIARARAGSTTAAPASGLTTRSPWGYVYFMKLHHLVDDKIHARSTGPYSLVTQQPLGGKAQFGGQRFGEMEVWALEAYGASYTSRRSSPSRATTSPAACGPDEAIVKGHNVPKPGVPESFKVLVKELQSLCLDIKVLDKDGQGDRAEGRRRRDDPLFNLSRMDADREREEYVADETDFEESGFGIEDVDEDDLAGDDGGTIFDRRRS